MSKGQPGDPTEFSAPSTNAASSLPTPSPGDVLGRYRVVRELGRGGMGAVFLAVDDVLAREVALKVVLGSIELAERRRFEREARSAARLRHPGIATVYDVGEHEGRPFLAMEFVAGETLAQRLKRGPLSPAAWLDLARQLAAALGAAHDAGVVHRDLKPGNVMCGNDGRIRLLDFGLAQHELRDGTTADGSTLTKTGVLVGTPAYMSPEQARGDRVGFTSDVFSLGALLHEAATGRGPFHGPNVFAVLAAVLSESVPLLSTVRSDLPVGASTIIARCLDKDPAARFASSREVARALELVDVVPTASSPSLSSGASGSSGGSSMAAGRTVLDGAARTRDDAPPSIACVPGRTVVLPWRNTARDPTHDWLGVGIADTLAHELRRSPNITVVEEARVGAAVGALQARTGGVEPMQVARALGAEWIVTGSYQVAGGRVRIVGAIGNALRDATTPCERVDGGLDDIFTLQDALVAQVRGVVGTTRVTSSSKEVRLAPGNPEAFEWYARGLLVSMRMTGAASAEAEQCLVRALEHDPHYALALAALGMVQMVRSLASGVPSLDEAMVPLQRAIALNPGLIDAHLWLSHIHMLRGRNALAVEHGRLAVTLGSDHPLAAMNLGICIGTQAGSDRLGPGPMVEAITSLRRAVTLHDSFGSGWSNLGMFLLPTALTHRIRAAFERALALEQSVPDNTTEAARWVGARVFLGVVEMYEGRLHAADVELTRGLAALEHDQHAFARPTAIFGQLARAECALRGRRYDVAEQGYAQVRAIAQAVVGVPGMYHHLVRATAGIARARTLAGDRAGARLLLDEVRALWRDDVGRHSGGYASSPSMSAYDIASALAAIGDRSGAIGMLEAAREHTWCGTAMMDGDPCFDAMRDDARLDAIRAAADQSAAAIDAALSL